MNCERRAFLTHDIARFAILIAVRVANFEIYLLAITHSPANPGSDDDKCVSTDVIFDTTRFQVTCRERFKVELD